ncbi:MAG: hypothetical protein ACXAD7_17475 [Candidatus Kariarchaeaceae archaeon]
MPLYIRSYKEFTYEIIYTEGRVKKKRIHVLINPGKSIKLRGQAQKHETELNPDSLTHIIAMETSVMNPKMINWTMRIAELTNKPIITNQETSEKFKEKGLSIRQLRLLGYEEEIIDGLHIDPIYKEELQEVIPKDQNKSVMSKITGFGKTVTDTINPLKWKPLEKFKDTVIPTQPKIEIDPSKPLAIYVLFGRNESILIPLDRRAIENINILIPNYLPKLVILPETTISDTLNIESGARYLLIVNETHQGDQTIYIPKAFNKVEHDTIYAAFEEWIEIE